MRRVAPLTVLVFLAVALICVPLAAGKPVVLKLKWRPVAGVDLSEDAVAVNDRYLAILDPFDGRLTLLDERAHTRKLLVPPSCESPPSYNPDAAGLPVTGFMFGGPWLMAGCGLYNLSIGKWTPFQLSSQCVGACTVVGIGRYWAKIGSDNGRPADNYSYYLQNLSTGQFVGDPASPGATTYDDLNAPSGSSPLCPPLRYPTASGPRGIPILGSLRFYGPPSQQFALISGNDSAGTPAYRLNRCHSSLNLNLPGDAYDGDAPIASSSAVVVASPDGITLSGWLLPSLRRFTLQPDRGTNEPVALTKRTIYVRVQGSNRLWSAPLPTASQIRACARYQRMPRRLSRQRDTQANPCRYNTTRAALGR